MCVILVVCLFVVVVVCVVVVVVEKSEKSSRTVENCGRDFSTSCDSILMIQASIER